jgi:hypothetical protein
MNRMQIDDLLHFKAVKVVERLSWCPQGSDLTSTEATVSLCGLPYTVRTIYTMDREQ